MNFVPALAYCFCLASRNPGPAFLPSPVKSLVDKQWVLLILSIVFIEPPPLIVRFMCKQLFHPHANHIRGTDATDL